MPTIGVFFGSRSPEHDVSIITAQLVISGLKQLGHQVVPVYLSKAGQWHIGDRLDDLQYFRDPDLDITGSGWDRYYLDLQESRGRMVFKRKGWFSKEIVIDLAFPAFHGSFGEDGTIQGLFEIFDVPYVGCDVTSSAVTMDKILTKQFYVSQNIPTTKFIYFDKSQWSSEQDQIIKQVNRELLFPLFVKPPRLGSSIGMAKVKAVDELEFAVEVVLHYGQRVLVEEGVEDLMDVTCCVLGSEPPRASLLQESLFGDELFSYEEKYLKKGGAHLGKAKSNIVIPARLDKKSTKEIQDQAVRIFQLFGCSGIARVDFLYDKKGKTAYANEVNTLPGTLYHHLWKASGVELGQLLTELLRLARERYEAKKQITYAFESNILKQSGSGKLGNLGDV